MNVSMPKAATRTVTGVALAAGLVLCVTAGSAQAGGTDGGVRDKADTSAGRVVLRPQGAGLAAAPATLTLSPGATRLVGGAAARVIAEYSCPKNLVGYLEVQLVEVTGSHVAQGYGSNPKPLTCDGAKHKMSVSAVVSNDYPLKAGKAFSQAVLSSFSDADPGIEATAATERTVTLH